MLERGRPGRVRALPSTIVYTLDKGWEALVHPNFYTQDM